MRVNVYAEEMTDRIEIIAKEIDGRRFTGLRFYLELPVSVGSGYTHRSVEGPDVYPPVGGAVAQVAGPFMHRPGDDDSSAVTFWGKRDLRAMLRKALAMLDEHYGDTSRASAERERDALAGLLGAISGQFEQFRKDVGEELDEPEDAAVVQMAADAYKAHKAGTLGALLDRWEREDGERATGGPA